MKILLVINLCFCIILCGCTKEILPDTGSFVMPQNFPLDGFPEPETATKKSVPVWISEYFVEEQVDAVDGEVYKLSEQQFRQGYIFCFYYKDDPKEYFARVAEFIDPMTVHKYKPFNNTKSYPHKAEIQHEIVIPDGEYVFGLEYDSNGNDCAFFLVSLTRNIPEDLYNQIKSVSE